MKMFIGLIILALSFTFASADIFINEVELNPEGTDSANEWLELYSDSFVNLTNWVISSSNGRNMTFNASFSGFYIINTSTNLLTNTDNNLLLKNSSSGIIFSSINLTDSLDDARTWQYCSGSWNFSISTPGAANNCTITSNNTNSTTNSTNNTCTGSYTCTSWTSCSSSLQTRACTNTSTSCVISTRTESQSCTSSSDISLDFSWNEEEIINNRVFNITLEANNLEDMKYDIKVWLESDETDLDLKSETYDEDLETWKSSNYFIEKFFKGDGDKTKEIQIRIKSSYTDYAGEATIYFRLRESDSEKTITTIDDSIEIIVSEEEEIQDSVETNSIPTAYAISNSDSTSENKLTTTSLIKKTAKTEDIKMPENSIYLSRTEQIKRYAPYAFCILCIFLLALIIIDSKKHKN